MTLVFCLPFSLHLAWDSSPRNGAAAYTYGVILPQFIHSLLRGDSMDPGMNTITLMVTHVSGSRPHSDTEDILQTRIRKAGYVH